MGWIESIVNDASEAKMRTTLNGPHLFATGCFYMQFGSVSYNTSTTETSIIWNQAATVNNTQSVPPITRALNLSSDPTGQGGPGSSLFLPGASQLNVPTGPYGCLTLGTYIRVHFVGSIKNNSSTPTFTPKLILRNAQTGAVAYTLSSKDITMVSTATATGVILDWEFQVNAIGTAGQITAVGNFTSDGWTTVGTSFTQTTVDTTQSYILDATATWGTSHANNALVITGGFCQLVG